MFHSLRANPDRTRLLVLLALCFFMFLFGAGQRPLWDTDEGMHAETSKEMVESGDWIVPHFNGEPFYDKPPLFTWLVALSFKLLGFNELAARLPAALTWVAQPVESRWRPLVVTRLHAVEAPWVRRTERILRSQAADELACKLPPVKPRYAVEACAA